MTLVWMVPVTHFSNKLRELKRDNFVSSKCELLRLRPFLDEDKIIRVRGCLNNITWINAYQRHKIILPTDNAFIKLLCHDLHKRLMHGRPQVILAAIRLKYWPINGWNFICNIVHKCVTWLHSKLIIVQPVMRNVSEIMLNLDARF